MDMERIIALYIYTIDRLNCGQTGRSIRIMKTSLHAFTSGGRHLHENIPCSTEQGMLLYS